MKIKSDTRGNIRRIGLVGALAVVILPVLAACGTTGATGATGRLSSATQTATPAAPAAVSTEAVGMTDGSTAGSPQAVETQPAEMTQMPDMTEEAATETVPPSDTGTSSEITPTPAADASGSSGAATEVQATLREWAIDLSQKEVAAGTVRFVVTNQGQFQHNLAVIGSDGQIAVTPTFGSAEGAQTLEVELAPGTYTIICNLPGHANRGQKTELVVK